MTKHVCFFALDPNNVIFQVNLKPGKRVSVVFRLAFSIYTGLLQYLQIAAFPANKMSTNVVPVQKTKRKRNPDFTAGEIDTLVDLFIQHNVTLTAKHGKITQSDKNSVYAEIRICVNAIGGHDRTLNAIKDKWIGVRKDVKDKAAEHLRYLRSRRCKTGGGEALPDDGETDEESAT